jgi:hypothetical protein
MIDFSLKTGICHEYLNNLFSGGEEKYNPEIIKNYPFFNYLLRSCTPNNFKYGKLGVLLTIFLGIVKKFDGSLVRYFDAFFYQILRELDFTKDGLTVPRMEVNAFKSFLNMYSELTDNMDFKVLSDNLCYSTMRGDDRSEAESITDDIEMHLCHVIVRYNVEQIMGRLSAVSRISIHEINKILLIKYFPRTLYLLDRLDVIPADFLIHSPLRMYHFAESLKYIKKNDEADRILKLELKIFDTKFFVQKDFFERCDRGTLKDLVCRKSCGRPVQVNDTIAVLKNYFASDIDLERWTGNGSKKRNEGIDVIVYYDYMHGKVRHQEFSGDMRDAVAFFRCGNKTRREFFNVRSDLSNAENLLNELIFKNILL